jgi:hypothetical protein
MFNTPVIDIFLSLSFTYFILSMAVSTLHEYVSVLMNKRGKQLEAAITALLFDTQWKSLSVKVYASSYINALKTAPDKPPSYIPAANFALALMEQFKQGKTIVLDMNTIRGVLLEDTQAAATGIEGDIRRILLGIYERSAGDLNTFQQLVEGFFNSAMDRVSGIYKRSAQTVIFIMSLCLSVALNADTIHIARTLWTDPAALKKTADNAQAAVSQVKGGALTTNSGQAVLPVQSAALTRTSTAVTDSTRTGASVVKQVTTTEVFLQQSGIPLGWEPANYPESNLLGWLAKIAGLLLTTAALTLGAPFWFDLLNKIVNIRGTGKKPEGVPPVPEAGKNTLAQPAG